MSPNVCSEPCWLWLKCPLLSKLLHLLYVGVVIKLTENSTYPDTCWQLQPPIVPPHLYCLSLLTSTAPMHNSGVPKHFSSGGTTTFTLIMCEGNPSFFAFQIQSGNGVRFTRTQKEKATPFCVLAKCMLPLLYDDEPTSRRCLVHSLTHKKRVQPKGSSVNALTQANGNTWLIFAGCCKRWTRIIDILV